MRLRPLLAGALFAISLAGCQDRKAVEIVNPCGEEIVVNLWESPAPRGAKNDLPTHAVVPARSTVKVKDALADVGKDGSAAEIISGPGTGEVLSIPHGGDLVVMIPTELCAAVE
jgi:hypothetical protein